MPLVPWREEARRAAAAALGSEVLEAHQLTGGNVSEVVERLRLTDGRSVVFKAATRWRGSGEMLDAAIRTEIGLYAKVPALTAWRPSLLSSVETDEWVGLVVENLDQPGRRLPPWSPADAESIAIGLAAAHGETLDGTHPPGLIAHREDDYWNRAATEGDLSVEWRTWVRAIAAPASSAIATAAVLASPRCVTHGDVYDDNIFLVGGQLRLIDWAQVGWTSPSRDAVSWALNAETRSGINAPSAFAMYEQHAGTQPVEECRSALAVTTGFMVLRLGQEPAGTEMHHYLIRRLRPAATWLAQELDVMQPPGT
ncbi:MAG TPA: phosphotransferase [Candidatus Dormibacteraeota bacterium]|nr:phosphotransferase [Candidatus Dormibacteraeota bacterium]